MPLDTEELPLLDEIKSEISKHPQSSIKKKPADDKYAT